MNKLFFKDHILVIKNAIKNNYCDEIVKTLDNKILNNFKFYDGLSVNPYEQIWFKNYVNGLKIYKKFNNFLKDGKVGIWNTDIECNLQKYKKNEYYSDEHCEQGNTYSKRIAVWMFYCNTITNGGETVFPQQGIKVKPEKGKLVIWPAAWTHSHYGKSCSKNKYIVTGWMSYI